MNTTSSDHTTRNISFEPRPPTSLVSVITHGVPLAAEGCGGGGYKMTCSKLG